MGIGTSVWWRPRGHVLQRGVCAAAPLYKTRKQWSSNGYLLLTHSLSLTQIVNTNTKSTHGATAISLDSNLPSQLFLSLSLNAVTCVVSLSHTRYYQKVYRGSCCPYVLGRRGAWHSVVISPSCVWLSVL